MPRGGHAPARARTRACACARGRATLRTPDHPNTRAPAPHPLCQAPRHNSTTPHTPPHRHTSRRTPTPTPHPTGIAPTSPHPTQHRAIPHHTTPHHTHTSPHRSTPHPTPPHSHAGSADWPVKFWFREIFVPPRPIQRDTFCFAEVSCRGRLTLVPRIFFDSFRCARNNCLWASSVDCVFSQPTLSLNFGCAWASTPLSSGTDEAK